eukprot:scaffold217766_cov32-Tisochrysis_lutea.AAC.4
MQEKTEHIVVKGCTQQLGYVRGINLVDDESRREKLVERNLVGSEQVDRLQCVERGSRRPGHKADV